MDFWSRLIGGVGSSQPKKSNANNNPQQRLARFKKTYNQVLQTWNKSAASKPNPKPDPLAEETIRIHLERLTTLLHDDNRAPVPHLCVAFAASSQIYHPISRVALALRNEGVVREAVALFSTLVDGDEEELVGNATFARQLMDFIGGVMGPTGVFMHSETEAEILELMFSIAAKIRLEPDLLPVWFTSKSDDADGSTVKTNGVTPNNEFPLCYHFIGHVYHEGRVGDFARTGLLYIFESASNSRELEGWIVESDLPTLMASGLGALYSQLSRKLAISHPKEELPLILALSDNDDPKMSDEAESFYSPELQSRLSTFMSYLIFWQDVLEHCRSSDIKQTLIDHFQIFFLQQILYPSLLESSDVDGGSSVAVLTYLWRVLDTIDHPDLIQHILNYLLALSGPIDLRPDSPESPALERSRESLLSLTQTNASDDKFNPSFFNLVDLILASVQSHNPETVTSSLRLMAILLRKHHILASAGLIRTIPCNISTVSYTIGILNSDLDMLISLAQEAAGEDNVDEAYSNCLKDALGLIENHICSSKRQDVVGPSAGKGAKPKGTPRRQRRSQIKPHYINVDDPLLVALMEKMKTFFTNDVETNLGLTNVLTHMASCPYTRLEGWLLSESPRERKDKDVTEVSDIALTPASGDAITESATDDIQAATEAEAARLAAHKASRETPSNMSGTASDFPRLIIVLQYLVTQVRLVRVQIPELSFHLANRKRAFAGESEDDRKSIISNPAIGTPILTPMRSGDHSRVASPTRGTPTPSTLQGQIQDTPVKQRALAVKQQDSPSPASTGSPRGRTIGALANQKKARGLSPSSTTPLRPSPLKTPSHARTGSRELSKSPTKPPAARALSPLSASFTLDDDNNNTPAISSPSFVDQEIYERKITFPLKGEENVAKNQDDGQGEETSAEGNVNVTSMGESPREATLNHTLTNAVILQEFILELAALVQVRASLLDGEVKFV